MICKKKLIVSALRFHIDPTINVYKKNLYRHILLTLVHVIPLSDVIKDHKAIKLNI